MKFVLITGLKETGKDTIIKLVLDGSKKILPKFKYINFKSIVREKWFEENIDKMEKAKERFYKDLEKAVGDAFKEGKHVIVNGYFTVKTGHGYLPVISEDFFDTFNPDILILIEAEKPKMKGDMIYGAKLKSLNDADWFQQEINRVYASFYSAVSGALLKIVTVKPGNVKSVIKEINELMRYSLD